MPLGRISLPETVDDPNASDDNSISASESRVGKEKQRYVCESALEHPLFAGSPALKALRISVRAFTFEPKRVAAEYLFRDPVDLDAAGNRVRNVCISIQTQPSRTPLLWRSASCSGDWGSGVLAWISYRSLPSVPPAARTRYFPLHASQFWTCISSHASNKTFLMRAG